jgi:hypothetical protein
VRILGSTSMGVLQVEVVADADVRPLRRSCIAGPADRRRSVHRSVRAGRAERDGVAGGAGDGARGGVDREVVDGEAAGHGGLIGQGLTIGSWPVSSKVASASPVA